MNRKSNSNETNEEKGRKGATAPNKLASVPHEYNNRTKPNFVRTDCPMPGAGEDLVSLVSFIRIYRHNMATFVFS